MTDKEFYLFMVEAMALLIDEACPANKKNVKTWLKRVNKMLANRINETRMRQFD